MDAVASRAEPVQGEETAIVFFDGVCNLCNGMIDFLIRRDKSKVLRYAPLQGETAHRLLTPEQRMNPKSFILLDEHGVHFRSNAAIRTLARLGGLWTLSKALLAIPRFLRDWVYNLVAGSRYRVWGKRDTCRLPTPEERDLFLP